MVESGLHHVLGLICYSSSHNFRWFEGHHRLQQSHRILIRSHLLSREVLWRVSIASCNLQMADYYVVRTNVSASPVWRRCFKKIVLKPRGQRVWVLWALAHIAVGKSILNLFRGTSLATPVRSKENCPRWPTKRSSQWTQLRVLPQSLGSVSTSREILYHSLSFCSSRIWSKDSSTFGLFLLEILWICLCSFLRTSAEVFALVSP